MHRGRQIELRSGDRDQHVDAERNTDLYLHGVLGIAVETLESTLSNIRVPRKQGSETVTEGASRAQVDTTSRWLFLKIESGGWQQVWHS